MMQKIGWLGVCCLLMFAAVFADDTVIQEDDTKEEFVCKHAGKTYKIGEQIETPDAVCFACTCHHGWTNPSATSCAIIDCPWSYYRSKPHCTAERVEGKCCPELRCSPPPPMLDLGWVTRKRSQESTDGYNITLTPESEITIYCISNNKEEYSADSATWTFSANDTVTDVVNGTSVQMAFFAPGTWAVYFPKVLPEDSGLYTCTIKGNKTEIQTTRLIVTTEPRLPVVDPVCFKPAFAEKVKTECQLKWPEHPWYYNSTSHDCVQHTEMCTWGEENVFGSRSECWHHCLDDCYARPESGPCKGEIRRYYYDHSTDSCRSFLYGGCQGNFNNFKTVKECEDSCASTKYRSSELNPKPDSSVESRAHCTGTCQWRDWSHYVHLGCEAVYEDGSCCPVRFNCNNSTKVQDQKVDSDVKCSHGGKNYSSGEMVPLNDMCMECPCTANFNGSYAPGCKPLKCNLEEMDEKLKKGCLPIYRNDLEELTCCPDAWQCPPKLKTTFRQGGKESLPKDPIEKQCIYAGQGYAMGFELVTGFGRCLYCACMTPPTFTCLDFACPDPPSKSNDSLRCLPKYPEPGNCCNDYECWNIIKEVDHIGRPMTEKEKNACKSKPCEIGNECLVNYTQCHLGDCEPICKLCAQPLCSANSRYQKPINECPYCEGPRTPEDACEWNPTYCPSLEQCVVSDENACATEGVCEPACRIEEIYATVRRSDSETN